MAGGIVAQYGFLYQRNVFLNIILANLGMGKMFVFEGADDIDVENTDDRIFKIANEKSGYVQVKSGNVNKYCFSKIIGNWLILETSDEDENTMYRLIVENELTYDVYNSEIQAELRDAYISAKNAKKSSICKKVYDKYKEEIESGKFLSILKTFISKIDVQIFPMENLTNKSMEIFNDNYNSDIQIYDIAKEKRYERFQQYIFADIDLALKDKKKYVLDFAKCIQIIGKCKEEISDKHYKVDFSQFKKKKEDLAKQIVEEAAWQEVRELKYVNPSETFVINEIIKELLYKEFRSVYIKPRKVDISNIEQSAKENYKETCNELGEKINIHELFFNTIKKTLGSSLLEDSPIYRNGCYTYLTGDEAEEDVKITWRVDNE